MKSFFTRKMAGLSLLLSLLFSASYGQLVITDTGGCNGHVLHATVTGTLPTGTGITADDGYSGVFPIGFTFNFYGTPHTQLVIGSNGVINFDLTLAGAYCPWPITAALLGNPSMRNAICGPWCDILISAGGSITRSLSGTAPNRKFSVTWCASRMFSCTTQWTTSQIILYETSNIVEVHVANKTICGWNGGAAIIGVQNAAGTAATVAPGRDWAPSWSVTTPPEAWRFTPTGPGAYTVATIPYAPLPYATSGIYWYNTTTGAYLGSGPYLPVNPSVPTTYTAAALGCNDTTRAFFTITPSLCLTPEVNLPCVGDTLWLNGAGDSTGATYEWFGPAPYGITPIATTQKMFRAPATAAMSGFYRVIKTVGAIRDTATIYANVFRPPAVTATSSLGFCTPITNTVNLFCATDSVCNSWSWVGPSSFSSTVQNPVMNPFDFTKEGVYTVTATSLRGCVGTGTVLVKPGPAPIVGPDALCQFFTINLTDATPGGTWSSSSPAIASITSGGVVSGNLPGTATITYTLPNTCYTTKLITVHPKPAPPGIPEVRPCQYTSVGVLTVNVTSAGYGTSWYGPGVTPATNFPTGVSSFIPGTGTVGTTIYYVTQTSPFGCVSDSAVYPVRVIAEPPAPATFDTNYCQNDLVVVPVKAIGDSLRWYTSSTATPGTGSLTAPTPPVNNPANITYYVTQTQNGCESPKAVVNVTIYVLPVFEITAERNWVCQFDSLQLNYNGPAYVAPAYRWTLPIGSDFVNGTTAADQNVMVRFDTVWGRHDVMLEVSNYNGRCSTRDTMSIRVVPAPNATGYIKRDLCLGDTTTLALTEHSSNANKYTWLLNGGPMLSSNAIEVITANSNTGGPYVITWVKPGIHIFNVTAITAEGCLAMPTQDTVKVHDLPNPLFSVSKIPNKLCVDDSVLFTAAVNDYAYNYKWEPEHSFANQNKAETWGKVELTKSIISLTVTDAFGCEATYKKQINPDECCTVAMPNAFTPNNDGKNDRFRPLFAGYRRFHQFRITNRWGQTVFESGNSEPAWDGTRDGIPQDMGTYFYYLRYDCGGNALETKGDVTLIR